MCENKENTMSENILQKYILKRIDEDNEKYFDNDEDLSKYFDFDNIPEDEFKRQCVDLRIYAFSSGFGGKVFYDSDKNEIISESAEITHSYDDTKKELKRLYNMSDWQIREQVVANNIKVIVLLCDISNNRKMMIDTMSGCGWSLAKAQNIMLNGTPWVMLSFDPMFQDDITAEVMKYDFVFHITPKYNIDAIMLNGLEPRSENSYFQYPKRLHILKGDLDLPQIYDIGKQLCDANNNVKNDGNYILLAITVKRLPESIRFYYDPRYEGGYYTKQNIPSNYIKPIATINFNNDKFFTMLK